ncbi:MAG: thioredoxin family protein [Candidatus Omnitrophota bacterium]
MKFKIFGKKNCAKCKSAKQKLEFFLSKWEVKNISLDFYDMDTIDGLSEGALHDVLKIPTIILEAAGDIKARWEGEIPKSEEIKTYLPVKV